MAGDEVLDGPADAKGGPLSGDGVGVPVSPESADTVEGDEAGLPSVFEPMLTREQSPSGYVAPPA